MKKSIKVFTVLILAAGYVSFSQRSIAHEKVAFENFALRGSISTAMYFENDTSPASQITEKDIDNLVISGVNPLTLVRPSTRVSSKNALSLIKAVEAAIQTHPDILTARSVLQSVEANLSVAQSAIYPQISFGGGLGASYSNTKQTGTNNNSGQLGIYAEQLIYDFGKTDQTISAAQIGTKKAKADVNVSIEKVTGDVVFAYIGALKAAAIVEANHDYIFALTRLSEVIAARAESGISDQSDVILTDVKLDSARSALLTAESADFATKSTLQSLIGRQYQNLQPPAGWGKHLGAPVTINMLDLHPEIISARYDIDAANRRINIEKASLFPRIGMQGSYQYDPFASDDGKPHNASFSLTVKGDLYQGGAGKYRIDAAVNAKRAAQAQLDSLVLTNRNRFEIASQSLVKTKAQQKVITAQIHNAEASRDTFFEQYKLGKRSLTDLLSSVQEIHTAKMTGIEMEYQYYFSSVQQAYAVGALVKNLKKSMR